MNFRKAAAVFIIFVFSGICLIAQDIPEEEFLKRLDMDEASFDRLIELNRETQQQAQAAAVEQKILQAQLEKLLLDEDPDMRKVEQLLRESLEWKLKVELARIGRSVEMRKILGEDRWLRFLRLRKEYLNRNSKN